MTLLIITKLQVCSNNYYNTIYYQISVFCLLVPTGLKTITSWMNYLSDTDTEYILDKQKLKSKHHSKQFVHAEHWTYI